MWMLSALLPKRNTAAVHTWPSYDDTALALIPELEKAGSIKSTIWPRDCGGLRPHLGPKVVVLPKRSLRAVGPSLPVAGCLDSSMLYELVFPPRGIGQFVAWHAHQEARMDVGKASEFTF